MKEEKQSRRNSVFIQLVVYVVVPWLIRLFQDGLCDRFVLLYVPRLDNENSERFASQWGVKGHCRWDLLMKGTLSYFPGHILVLHVNNKVEENLWNLINALIWHSFFPHVVHSPFQHGDDTDARVSQSSNQIFYCNISTCVYLKKRNNMERQRSKQLFGQRFLEYLRLTESL